MFVITPAQSARYNEITSAKLNNSQRVIFDHSSGELHYRRRGNLMTYAIAQDGTETRVRGMFTLHAYVVIRLEGMWIGEGEREDINEMIRENYRRHWKALGIGNVR